MKNRKFDLQLFTVPENTILSADLAKVRDIDFVEQFSKGLDTLQAMLGVTRKIEKKDGEVLKVYKVTGTLESGVVAEGEVIPLSAYETTYTPIGEATLKKWRKVTTAEAITNKGYNQAVNDTNLKMVKDAQKRVRSTFVDYLGTGTSEATGIGLQATLAQIWGKLQVLWEDTAVQTVFFLNPMDIADYLGHANVSVQTAFGMSYIENFLGIGTVILASDVPAGKVYATAVDNIVLYYIPVNGAGLGEAFDFTTDETGLIGVHTGSVYNNVSVETVAVSGVGLFAEQIAGIVVGTIASEDEAEEDEA